MIIVQACQPVMAFISPSKLDIAAVIKFIFLYDLAVRRMRWDSEGEYLRQQLGTEYKNHCVSFGATNSNGISLA